MPFVREPGILSDGLASRAGPFGWVRKIAPSLGLPPKIEDVRKVVLWFKLEAIMKRSKFTEEQIVRILQEAASGQKTQAQLCRDHGVSANTFYVWKRKYAGMQTDDVRHLRELERENAQLKRLLAERDLEIDAVRALFRKNGLALPNPSRGRDS